MKLIQTLSVALLAASTAMAQGPQQSLTHSISNPKMDVLRKGFLNMVMGSSSQLAGVQKSTATKQRVLAESTYGNTGTSIDLLDSTRHYYPSDAGGSRFDYNQMAYNSSYDPLFSPIFPVSPHENNGLDVLNDSMRRWSDQGNGFLEDYQVQSFVFDSQKRVSDCHFELYSFGNTGSYRMIHGYDSIGRLDSVVALNFKNSNWDTVGKKLFYYDAANRISHDTSYQHYDADKWAKSGAMNYSYDTSGKITRIVRYDTTSGGWAAAERFTARYYPNNLVKAIVAEMRMGSALSPYSIDSFGYAGNNPISTYWKWDTYSSLGMEPYWIVKRHLNAATHLPDTVWEDRNLNSGWALVHMTALKYNSYNNPVTVTIYNISGANSELSYIQNYYYELYQDLLAVNNTPSAKADINIYPNPGKDVININWNGFKQGNVVEVSIVNAAGQMVHKEQMNWMQQTETINIASLQPGMYWMSISNASGKVYTQSILKQ